MKHDFLKTPEGNITDFSIQYDKFKPTDDSFKQFFGKFKEQKSINIKVNKTDLEFLNELAQIEGVSKNDLLETCINDSIEEFLYSLDMPTKNLIIEIFEEINNCKYHQNQRNFINSWFVSCYTKDLQNTIGQFEQSVQEIPNLKDQSGTYDFFRNKLYELPALQELINRLDAETNTKDIDVKNENIDMAEVKKESANASHTKNSFLQDRLDMLLLIDNHKNLVENQDFQIVTFRSNLKIIGMMEILSFLLNIPMNQLFYESLHESVAQLAIYYDKDNHVLKNIIYKITNNQLKTLGFIDVLIKNNYIKYYFNRASAEKYYQIREKIKSEKQRNKVEVKDE